MKNKKFLCLVLALVMVLGAFGPVFAETKAADDKKEEAKVEKVEKVTGKDAKIQWLVDHKFVEGRKVNEDPKDNDLALDKTIKRSEITKLLVYAIGRQDLAEKIQGTKIYKDVEATHWANGVITVGTSLSSPANNVPFLNGYPDGTFKPERDVTYGELAKMLVTLVKKDLTKDMHDGANKPGIWPGRWITWATELRILDDVKLEDGNKAALRSDAFVMLYNALYKIENLRKVPANETMGIISGYSKGKLVLNQGDYKKEFTVNVDTNFVYGWGANEHGTPLDKYGMVNWNDNLIGHVEGYYLGSLVRVLADDKGVVTHIIQLGTPVHGDRGGVKGIFYDRITNGWRTVADGTIGTDYIDLKGVRQDTTVDVANGKLTFKGGHITVRNGKNNVYDNYDRDGNVEEVDQVAFEGKEVINLTHETRYFVADYWKGHLTEVKDLNAVKALLDNTIAVTDVYAGFDVLPKTGIKEATVVVFNTVHSGGGEIVRVHAPQETDYTFKAHKPNMERAKAELVSFDLRNDNVEFPFGKNWEKYDVLDISRRVDGAVVASKLIDGSHDPIYKITKVNEKEIDGMGYIDPRRINTIELTDGDGKLTVDVRVDTDYFFGDEVKVGAFAQVHFLKTLVENDEGDNGKPIYKVVPAVDIISVIDDPIKANFRGQLPKVLKPTNLREVSGTFVKTEGEAKNVLVFVIKEGDSIYETTFVTSKDNKAYFANFKEGDKITFLVDKAKSEAHDHDFATDIKNPQADDRIAAAAAEAFEGKIDELDVTDPMDDAKAKAIEDLNEEFENLDEAVKEKISKEKKDALADAVAKAKAFRKEEADKADVAAVKAEVEKIKEVQVEANAKVTDVKDALIAKINELDLKGVDVVPEPKTEDPDTTPAGAKEKFDITYKKGTAEATSLEHEVTVKE